MFKNKSKQFFSKDMGIDLGTATVLVYVEGKEIVLNEPSVVAVDTNTDHIVKIGKEAQEMLGRNPNNIDVIRPLKDGVINNYDVTQKMIQHFIRRACANSVFPPRVVICIPTGTNDVEARAVIDAGTQGGARKVYLIEEPVAAALGADLDISTPIGRMIVDIGGGTTDVAVISLGGVVVSESIRIAGDKFDEAIIKYVRKKYNIMIGERMAEQIKLRIGAVYEHGEARVMEVKGRCQIDGFPKKVTLSSKEMLEAMMDPISTIIDAICSVVERTPPELVGDIIKGGIVMTGGGSLLRGLDRLIHDVTGIKTRVAPKPIECVAMGTGRVLKVLDGVPEGLIDLSRIRKKI